MTIKRSVGIGFIALVVLNLIIIVSEVYLAYNINAVDMQRSEVLRIKDDFNNAIIEHNVWLDDLTEHVMDGWPFDKGLDVNDCPVLNWIEAQGDSGEHEHDPETVKNITDTIHKQYRIARMIVDEQDLEEKRSIYIDEFAPAIQALRPEAAKYVNHFNEEFHEINADFARLSAMSRNFKIAAACFTILALIVLALFFVKTLLKPLGWISTSMGAAGSGDLRNSIEYGQDNEIGIIAQNFNYMISSLAGLIRKINSTAGSIYQAVENVKGNSTKTSESSRAQAMKAAQIASTSDEMNQTILDIAKNASVAAMTSSDAMDAATSGKRMAEETKEIEQKVFESTTRLSGMMDRLSNKAGEISNIVEVINDIADQTNLLALNAAIEAARAGEQGRGFGVVADEVRKLAERTLRATSDISSNIGEVIAEIKSTASSMDSVTSEVTQATEGINNLEGALGSIVNAVRDVSDKVSHIATAVEQQSSATEEVSQEIENSASLSKEIEGRAAEVVREVDTLISVSEELNNSIKHFKV